MISDEVIKGILEAGIRAPSGENSQPWRFKIEEEQIWLFNWPDADQSLYNFHQNGSFISHGAVLENIRIAASALGFEANIELFPNINKKDLVAVINLHQTEPKNEPLLNSIERRITNRKHYDGSPLSEHEKRKLLENGEPSVQLRLIEDRDEIATLAHAASVNETMLVLNKYVHDFFFNHVRWTAEENEIQPNGFYVDTLELNAKQAKGFRMLRKWGTARILGKLGVAKAVGKDNEETYKTASAMIGVITKDSSPRSLVLAGQVLEHAWLTATELGLNVQPSAGVLFLAEGARKENHNSFSVAENKALKSSRESIYKIMKVDENAEHIAVIFRIGRGDKPTAHAARFPIKHFLI